MKKLLMLATCLLLSMQVAAENVLRVATTTSTENSGLLSVLNPPFARKNKVRLDVISAGSGKALRLGKNGDVDVVFVHAPIAEQYFLEQKYGVGRKAVMHNDFVIIGPESDPVGIKASKSALDAFEKLTAGKGVFISRGDDSGTHKKETVLWQKAQLTAPSDWYISAGQGMGAVLRMADDKQAYTLTDRGTYLSYQDKIDLVILYQGDAMLFNPYHIMAVNPLRHKHVQFELAKKYIDYVTGPEGQAIIQGYKIGGQQMFYPDAIQ